MILTDVEPLLTRHLGANQFEIHKKPSTTHAIIIAHDILTKLADDPEIGATVFISFDFRKGFVFCSNVTPFARLFFALMSLCIALLFVYTVNKNKTELQNTDRKSVV